MSTESFYQKDFCLKVNYLEMYLPRKFLSKLISMFILLSGMCNIVNREQLRCCHSPEQASCLFFSRKGNAAFESLFVVIRASISPDSPAKPVNHLNEATCFRFGKRGATEDRAYCANFCALAVGVSELERSGLDRPAPRP